MGESSFLRVADLKLILDKYRCTRRGVARRVRGAGLRWAPGVAPTLADVATSFHVEVPRVVALAKRLRY